MVGLTKSFFKNLLIFIITLVICAGTLLLVCQIPQSAIEKNSRDSAEYFSSHQPFPLLIGDKANSRADNYADCVLFNVIYNIDSNQSFKSVIADSYYRNEGEEASDDYEKAVFQDKAPNSNYSRYWHGSQVFIRPLLTFLSVEKVRLAVFLVLTALNVVLGVLLVRRRLYGLAAAYFASMVLVEIWMAAFTLEYIMTFIVMTAAAIGVVCISHKYDSSSDLEKLDRQAAADKAVTGLFIVAGAATCFLDFLTTETLTFTVPLIMLLFIKKQQGIFASFKEEFTKVFKWGIAWVLSYGGMFAAKWALVWVVLGKSAFFDALQNAALRIEGEVTVDGLGLGETATMAQRLTGLLARNLGCMFPLGSQASTFTAFGLTLAALALLGAFFYLFRKTRLDGGFIGLLLLVGLIPYLRLLCLSNHSYIHYFFTYRAQMATVLCILTILICSIKLPFGKHKKS